MTGIPFDVGKTMSLLLPFPPSDNRQPCVFDLSGLLHEICESLESESCRCGVHVETDAPPYTMICGDRSQLGQALLDLLTMVCAVTPKRSSIILTALTDAEIAAVAQYMQGLR